MLNLDGFPGATNSCGGLVAGHSHRGREQCIWELGSPLSFICPSPAPSVDFSRSPCSVSSSSPPPSSSSSSYCLMKMSLMAISSFFSTSSSTSSREERKAWTCEDRLNPLASEKSIVHVLIAAQLQKD